MNIFLVNIFDVMQNNIYNSFFFFFLVALEDGLFLCIGGDPLLHLPVLRQVSIYETIYLTKHVCLSILADVVKLGQLAHIRSL